MPPDSRALVRRRDGSAVEYRVRWRRDGRERSTRIYQTRQAAERKVRGILALEAVKDDTMLADMPDLSEPPTIEQRAVGEWDASGITVTPTDKDHDGMREYFTPDDGYSGIF